MVADPRFYKDPKQALGMPEDDMATDTTSPWSMIALLKGVYAKLSGTITVTSPVGAATEAKQDMGNTSLSSIDGKLTTLAGYVDTLEALVASTNTLLTTQAGYLDGIEALLTTLNGYVDTLEAKLARASTGTQSSVADNNADTTILASNANRLGASIYNDSTEILYLLLANATSSSTNFSVKMQPDGYFEVPAGYTGVIKGIWAANGSGSARVTEYT